MDNIRVIADKDEIVAIADAIRSKTGSSEKMNGLTGIANAVNEIGTGENLDAEINAQAELIDTLLTTLDEKAGVGGGEINTCTMRFVDDGDIGYTHYHYIKCVNGVMSMETINNGDPYGDYMSGFDITIENIVCGSLIYFAWSNRGSGFNDPYVTISGSQTSHQVAERDGVVLESCLFVAPEEPDVTCTVTLIGG